MILRTSNDLAELIRARRRELGLSQEELADLSGLHRMQISLIERDQRVARFDTVLRIVHTLGMDLEAGVRGR
jgi:HTH-type transcriptional regulator / antitoxin HipB